jgi:hypothetical protein
MPFDESSEIKEKYALDWTLGECKESSSSKGE